MEVGRTGPRGLFAVLPALNGGVVRAQDHRPGTTDVDAREKT